MRTATRFVAIIICVLAGVGRLADTQAADMTLPEGARDTIAQVQQAAEAHDFVRLRALMIDEFLWSFGGDAAADQAIDAWRADARLLDELLATLRRGCRPSGPDRIECPGQGDLGYRAGLARTPSGWRLEYFIAGD